MADITRLLRSAAAGDTQSLDAVVGLLYEDLRQLARSRLRQSGDITLLDATALVHESWMRFQNSSSLAFESRGRFLGYAAKVMRSVVIDAVRARQADRRGGAALHVTLNTLVGDAVAMHEDEVLRVHEALEELAGIDTRLTQVVEMRYFGGLSEAEIADCLGVTERTVQRDWQKAKMLLAQTLR